MRSLRAAALPTAPVAPEAFTGYPSEARRLAISNLPLIERLPVVFRAVLLREVIAFDWKFPIERRRLTAELHLLASLSPESLGARMSPFGAIQLPPQADATQAIANPSGFIEQLTAWLWSSSQMDSFRATAESYGAFLAAEIPRPRPAQRRLTIILIGQDVSRSGIPLFRKLRPHGVHFSAIQSTPPDEALTFLLDLIRNRAVASAAEPYSHWYIDGGLARSTLSDSLTVVSYHSLEPARHLLLARIQRAIDSGSMNAESLRTLVAQTTPVDIGLPSGGTAAPLAHFNLSLLTEGSGTQIFSTTFVQWAARECLRRAEPETLLLRFAPRQTMQPMNVMLSAAAAPAPPDPQGSLIDADMAAYYTWINLNRLPGADEMSFLVWHEGRAEALAISPRVTPGTASNNPIDLQNVLALLA